MSHQDTYRHNEAYAEFLAGWDPNFYVLARGSSMSVAALDRWWRV
jgi:hypothetical protein